MTTTLLSCPQIHTYIEKRSDPHLHRERARAHARVRPRRTQSESVQNYSVYLLYWYKGTNTDAGMRGQRPRVSGRDEPVRKLNVCYCELNVCNCRRHLGPGFQTNPLLCNCPLRCTELNVRNCRRHLGPGFQMETQAGTAGEPAASASHVYPCQMSCVAAVAKPMN